jgi:hypothetical protein
MSWIRNNLTIVLPVTAVALGAVAFLAFGVFGVHTLFIDDTVDESGPVFDSGVAADTGLAGVDDARSTSESPGASAAPTPAADESPLPAATVPPAAATAPEIVTLAEGTFIPRGRYSGEGRAVVLNDGSEQRFLRFEDFATDNGPDLNVYLVASTDANGDSGAFDDDFIDLGDLKGNIGDQNYEIPPDVDLSIYDTVVVWCVRFASPFTAADLISTG